MVVVVVVMNGRGLLVDVDVVVVVLAAHERYTTLRTVRVLLGACCGEARHACMHAFFFCSADQPT